MKIDKSDIAGRLAKIKTAIPGKSSTFGVQGVLIRGNKAIANNYEIGITATLPMEVDEAFILPLKAIEMIDSLPDGEIEILSGADHKITIITKGGILMIEIPDSFAIGAFVGTIFGLTLYPFVIGTVYQKPEIYVVVTREAVIHKMETRE